MYDSMTGEELVLDESGMNNRMPDIHGHRVVWRDFDDEGRTAIRLYDIDIGERRTLASPAADPVEMPPNQVHWIDENGMGHTIFWIEDNNGNVLQADPVSGQVPPIALEDLPKWVKDQTRNIPNEVLDQLPQEIKQDYLDKCDALNSGALLNSNHLFSTWCTINATSPNRIHRTISATGSLNCTSGDQTQLRVTIQRHRWGRGG